MIRRYNNFSIASKLPLKYLMIKELESLLSVKPDEVSNLLKEFEPNGFSRTRSPLLKFHYIRFQNNKPRLINFIEKLCGHTVTFCLKREKYKNVDASDYWRVVQEAKKKFAHPKDGKTGEPGELILFLLLEGVIRVPKILSKMSLKTSSQMHIHGGDGVHLGINGQELILYFGESKLYGVHTQAISDVLASVKKFVSEFNDETNDTQEEFEITVLSDHLDIPSGPLREKVMRTLDPYSAERDNLKSVHACFVGFDLQEITGTCDFGTFKRAYEKKAESCYKYVVEKINQDPVLKSLSWHFFFMPFGSVQEFREKFLKALKS